MYKNKKNYKPNMRFPSTSSSLKRNDLIRWAPRPWSTSALLDQRFLLLLRHDLRNFAESWSEIQPPHHDGNSSVSGHRIQLYHPIVENTIVVLIFFFFISSMIDIEFFVFALKDNGGLGTVQSLSRGFVNQIANEF